MKPLIEFLASSLVDDSSAVFVDEKESPQGLVYQLRVAQKDLGKVIGKKGRTAKAMRTLLMAVGARDNKNIWLEILEPESEGQSLPSSHT